MTPPPLNRRRYSSEADPDDHSLHHTIRPNDHRFQQQQHLADDSTSISTIDHRRSISNVAHRRLTKLYRRYACLSTRQKWTICVLGLFLLLFSPYLLYNSLNSEIGQRRQTTSTNTFVEPAAIDDDDDEAEDSIDGGDKRRPIDNSRFSSSSRSPMLNSIVDDETLDDEVEDSFFAAFEPDRHVVDVQKRRLKELDRIRVSILNELRSLEERRNSLRTEIDRMQIQSERLQTELRRKYEELEREKVFIEQVQLNRKELQERNTPEIALPRPLAPRAFSNGKTIVGSEESTACSMATCFDYGRCSITSGFPIYVYGRTDHQRGDYFDSNLVRLLSASVYAVEDPSSACLFLAPLKLGVIVDEKSIRNRLEYWNRTEDGANHVLLISGNRSTARSIGRSLLIGDQVDTTRFGFDILSPKIHSINKMDDQDEMELLDSPPIIPVRRRYLLSITHCPEQRPGVDNRFLLDQLSRMASTKTDDLFYFHSNCHDGTNFQSTNNNINDQLLDERSILAQSTFTLLIFDDQQQQHRSQFIDRFVRALRSGAVPVIISSSRLPYSHFLPYGETLDWSLATIQLASSRLPELHFYLRTINDPDIVQFRKHARLFYRSYFSSTQKRLETVLAILRQRLNIPAAPIAEFESSSSYLNETFQPTFGESTALATKSSMDLQDMDEYLGPVELPYPSPRFQQNFTGISTFGYRLWNEYADPFRMYPQNPFTTVSMPAEAKFLGSPYGHRPINDGAGGSGREFSEALGGNHPREQFTIVLLTYERERVLIDALARLNKLPYLNKVIVVWNGPTPPNSTTVWPKLSAPVVVIKPEKNSLNNRFLPYREIETEAVLSMDDDVTLRKDEIVFGFRVWREARERVVGFPARFHAWDSGAKQWAYNSNHTCELSMVLTGAAFIHKYYFYVYTYSMPALIRNKVDELKNCEDIAMNFLVSHMTKLAPLKATSRWTFRCKECPITLSADESHFLERHDCLNYFTRIYGYNPLVYTQFRVDSILFKTIIPRTHQKCFKWNNHEV